MEPLKPQERARILSEHPDVEPQEIDEYERLLAERFATEPDLAPNGEAADAFGRREARLAELYERFFQHKVSSSRSGW